MRFLELWLRTEAAIHRGISDPDLVSKPDKLRSMLNHYSVQRNFPGLDRNIASEIAVRLHEVADGGLTPVASVEAMVAWFKARFDRHNLSAASKLLWMRYRHPHVIIDTQAFNALQKGFNRSFDKHNYGEFFAVWNEEYAKHADAVRKASLGLVALPRNYTAAFSVGDAELNDLVSQRWFQARVFDVYLWEIGKS